ncbi:hypothetical protein [Streptomyces malaysiensis]|uniref:hypothetical protein n=1 Tax=Streptomyces malaysiensis TaxID=92644 RepID=UPI002B32358D|nr:hypothetical protein R8789_26845 [Streptomyces malaysiensis]
MEARPTEVSPVRRLCLNGGRARTVAAPGQRAVPVRWPFPNDGRARTAAVPVRRIVRAGGRAEAAPRPG